MPVQSKAAQLGLQLRELRCHAWWQAGQALHGPAPTTAVCCWPCMALRMTSFLSQSAATFPNYIFLGSRRPPCTSEEVTGRCMLQANSVLEQLIIQADQPHPQQPGSCGPGGLSCPRLMEPALLGLDCYMAKNDERQESHVCVPKRVASGCEHPSAARPVASHAYRLL